MNICGGVPLQIGSCNHLQLVCHCMVSCCLKCDRIAFHWTSGLVLRYPHYDLHGTLHVDHLCDPLGDLLLVHRMLHLWPVHQWSPFLPKQFSQASAKSSGGSLYAAFSALQLKILELIICICAYFISIFETYLSKVSRKNETCLVPRLAKLCQCTMIRMSTFGP